MTDAEILDMYKPLVPFLASLCGTGCEILLHDVSKADGGTVIAIANGYHSGRHIGSPMTDLANRIRKDRLYETQDFLANYHGISKNKKFISNTYFIKNGKRLIGLLCVNRDTTAVHELDLALARMKKQFNLSESNLDIQENLATPVETMLSSLVARAVEKSGILPQRMSRQEKVHIVHQLNEQGILKMKGAVAEIARQLMISEPTVYRYLNRE
jgi:predicted transcriptional regulator YheO